MFFGVQNSFGQGNPPPGIEVILSPSSINEKIPPNYTIKNLFSIMQVLIFKMPYGKPLPIE